MYTNSLPVIDLTATGQNIIRIRKALGLSVRDIQNFFGFEEPQAVYKWQQGKSLPTVDNLLALSTLFGVPMEQILVIKTQNKQQAKACCSYLKIFGCERYVRRSKTFPSIFTVRCAV